MRGQPCEICGDPGIAKAIATCSKCHKSRQHIYCMHRNLQEVPKSWFCEACQRQDVDYNEICHSDGRGRHNGEELYDSSKREKASKICDASRVAGSSSGKLGGRLLSKDFVPKKVETGKVRFLPLEDIYAVSSGAKTRRSFSRGGPSSQSCSFGFNHHPTLKKTSVALASSSKSTPKKDHAYKSTAQPKPVTVGRLQTSTLHRKAVKSSQPDIKSQSLSSCKSPTSVNINTVAVLNTKDKRHTIDEVHHAGPLVCGVKELDSPISRLEKYTGKVDSISLQPKGHICKDQTVKAIVPFDESGTLNSKTSSKFGDEDLPNPPALNASWKGSFEILDLPHELYDGFEAYPPEKVSRKAYLVSKQMPGVLQFTLQPRSDVWPDIFHTDSPSGFDIALYFLADDICRKNYNCLLQMMEKLDLSMQSHLDGVELLIFTSRQLPVKCQRMNQQLYFWGVFLPFKGRQSPVDLKGKRHTSDFPVSNSRFSKDFTSVTYEVDDQVVDMEIDMVAGKAVGAVDECIRSNSRDSCPDISQDMPSNVHSDLPVGKDTRATHLHQIKREHSNNIDGPPGFSRSVSATSISRPFTSNAADEVAIGASFLKMLPVSKTVDAPPGFSKAFKLQKRDSSKVSTSTPPTEKTGCDLPRDPIYAIQGKCDYYGNKVIEHRHGMNYQVGSDSKRAKGSQEEKLFHMEQMRRSPRAPAHEFRSKAVNVKKEVDDFAMQPMSGVKCLQLVCEGGVKFDQEIYGGTKKVKTESGRT